VFYLYVITLRDGKHQKLTCSIYMLQHFETENTKNWRVLFICYNTSGQRTPKTDVFYLYVITLRDRKHQKLTCSIYITLRDGKHQKRNVATSSALNRKRCLMRLRQQSRITNVTLRSASWLGAEIWFKLITCGMWHTARWFPLHPAFHRISRPFWGNYS
jgi:hypothetical protein